MLSRAPRSAAEVLALAQEATLAEGLQAWLVGGAVRDRLLGRATGDLDLALAGGALACAERIAAASGGTRVLLDADRDMARVVWPGRPPLLLDLAALAGASLAADLAARDFTVNALAVPLSRGLDFGPAEVIDPTGGLADLAARRLRAAGPGAFREDPLRLLRAVRLAGELGFGLAPETEAAVRAEARLVARPAPERARDELLRILANPGPAAAVAWLRDLGLLAPWLPELVAGVGLAQAPPHDRDVFDHSLAVLAAVETLDAGLRAAGSAGAAGAWPAAWPAAWGSALARFGPALAKTLADEGLGGPPRALWLRLAALLHDIGKPVTRAQDEATGRVRFLGHDQAGAVLAGSVAERLRLSHRQGGYLATVLRQHLRPLSLAEREGPPSRRAVYRYFQACGGAGVDVALLSLADEAGKADPGGAAAERLAAVVTALWSAWFEAPAERVRPRPVLDGRQLMAALDLPPGPSLGRLLAAIAEAQAAGEVGDAAGALALARRLLAEEPPAEGPIS